MHTISPGKTFTTIAYCYIALPTLIFVLGWLRWPVGIPLAAALVYTVYRALQAEKAAPVPSFTIGRSKALAMLAVLAGWLLLSGIGGCGYQNEDHQYRNAILNDLVSHSWPVTYHIGDHCNIPRFDNKETVLSYYIGYWLPAALTGKLAGRAVADVTLWIWTFLGMAMVVFFSMRYLRRASCGMLLLLLFFGNVYILASLHYFPLKDILGNDYNIWSGNLALFESMTDGVYWVFNQCITSWLIFILILGGAPRQNVLFLYAFAFFQGPFPFLGMAPFVGYIVLRDCFGGHEAFMAVIKKYLSVQNLLGVAVFLPVCYIFLSGNSAGKHFSIFHPHLRTYLLFIAVSFGIISLLIFPKYRKEPLFYIAAGMMCVLPFVQVGFGVDFSSRVSIPSMFVLVLLVGRFITEDGYSKLKPAVIGYVCLSAISPLLEVGRSAYLVVLDKVDRPAASRFIYDHASEYHYIKLLGPKPEAAPASKSYLQQNDLQTLQNPANVNIANFMAIKDSSLFYKHLAKHE